MVVKKYDILTHAKFMDLRYNQLLSDHKKNPHYKVVIQINLSKETCTTSETWELANHNDSYYSSFIKTF